MGDDSDDDLPTLSAETFAALQQFYTEEEHRESIKLSVEECSTKKPDDMTAFNEDWNLSQFWYDDQTSEILAKACVQGAGLTGHIACISAPTAYVAIKSIFLKQKLCCLSTINVFPHLERTLFFMIIKVHFLFLKNLVHHLILYWRTPRSYQMNV